MIVFQNEEKTDWTMIHNQQHHFPKGLISVVQTPFSSDGRIDFCSLERLLEDVLQAGTHGILAPVVASEVAYLSVSERFTLVKRIANIVNHRVPFLVGASSSSIQEVQSFAQQAQEVNADGYLVAIPDTLYQSLQQAIPFCQKIAGSYSLPFLIQDLRWNEYGLPLSIIEDLWTTIPTLAGFKIETVPAGPKYTQIREKLGEQAFLCGGWAIPQLIESLDRGVDAMIPESSMIRVYKEILRLHHEGNRNNAIALFHRLLPVLSFANQELTISIAFFKRLLIRKGIFESDTLRCPNFQWDRYNQRIADELIDHYLHLEEQVIQE